MLNEKIRLTKNIFDKGMVRLATVFKKDDPSPMFASEYFYAICHLSDTQFDRAVNHLMQNHRSAFFPVPAEFLQAVVDSKVYEPPVYTPQERQVEVTYPGIPDSVKKMMQETLEKINKRGMK